MLRENSTRVSANRRNQFMELFGYPVQAGHLISQFFSEEDMDFIFTYAGRQWSGTEPGQEITQKYYQRGIVRIADREKQLYEISDFYSMLDVFVISRKDVYDTFSRADKKLLDDWYFAAFYEGLPEVERPTEDEILPLEEVIERINQDDRNIYLNYCDCRSLTGDCGLPRKTCITYRNGTNTFADRGLSEQITKERAVQVVRAADRAGLMHTVNSGGICNCCGDCCYLFRGQEKRGSAGIWPRTHTIAVYEPDQCIQCGVCAKRCHMDVFEKKEKLTVDLSKCVGCGICVNACPAQALELKER